MTYPLEEVLLPMGANEVKDEAKMEALWDDNDYIAECKYDGSRYLSVGGRMFSRRLSVKDNFPVEKTDNVPHISEFLKKYPNLVLDGEVYYEGLSSNEVTSIMGASTDKALWRQGFGQFQAPFLVGSKGKWRMSPDDEWVEVPKKEVAELIEKEGSLVPLKYVAFDILRDLEGNWLTNLPWEQRRAKLLKTYADICMDNGWTEIEFIEVSQVEREDKREFYKEILAQGGEGVILKNVKALYVPAKKPAWNWVKVKKHITDDVVIMGFKPAQKEYNPLRPELIDTHPYWEHADESGTQLVLNPTQEEFAHYNLTPVTKFYFYDWIGAVTFGKFDLSNVVTLCDRNGANCQDYPQLKELGYCSGLTEELRKDMSENPDKYLYDCMEISAMETTKDGFYRHPQFSRMRPDKNPNECVLEV